MADDVHALGAAAKQETAGYLQTLRPHLRFNLDVPDLFARTTHVTRERTRFFSSRGGTSWRRRRDSWPHSARTAYVGELKGVCHFGELTFAFCRIQLGMRDVTTGVNTSRRGWCRRPGENEVAPSAKLRYTTI